jgi:serine-type D-Ala-D-Ala carboxypeptidase/endopeptidase
MFMDCSTVHSIISKQYVFARRALVFLGLLGAHRGSIAMADNLISDAPALIQPYVEAGICQGISVGLWRDGESEVLAAGMSRDDEDSVPGAGTLFEIGSVSKTFTGLLLADAVVRGKTKLETPVSQILSDMKVSHAFKDDITFLHLATHTSGLPRLPSNLNPADPLDPYADYHRDALMKCLSEETGTKEVGKQMEYSNLGLGLLGELLAIQAGTTYEILLKSRVFKPLGMADSTITLNPDEKVRLAAPHGEGGVATKNWNFVALAGAGGVRSTTADMLKYVSAMIEPPGNALGKAIDLAWKVHQTPIQPSDFAMGLGWHIARDGQTRWHNGETGGYHSIVLVNRDNRTGVVVLANTANGEVDKLGEDLMRALAGMKVKPREFEKSLEVAPDVMARYVGKYAMSPEFALVITKDADGLIVQATDQPAFRLYARSATEWFLRVVDATITFKQDEDGEWNELDLFQGGIHQPAIRVPAAATEG